MLVWNKCIEFLFQDNLDSNASDNESQSNVVDANVNTINAISSADSIVNVNNLAKSCESDSSKFASSDVQNTASSVAENKPAAVPAAVATTTTCLPNQNVAEVDTSSVKRSGTDAETKSRVSTSSSPVLSLLIFF